MARNSTSLRSAPRRRNTQVRLPEAEQDVTLVAEKYRCAGHQVDYYRPRGTDAECPVCDLDQQLAEVREALHEVNNRYAMTAKALEALQPVVELGTAVNNAIELLEPTELGWLKAQLYQYRIDKSVMLKVTHGALPGGKAPARGNRLPANGFIADYRHGKPDVLLCTSVGGAAIADYYDEAVTLTSTDKAMQVLLRSFWRVLPGGAR